MALRAIVGGMTDETDEDRDPEGTHPDTIREGALWDAMTVAARVMVARAIDLWGLPAETDPEFIGWNGTLHEELRFAIGYARRNPGEMAEPIDRPKRKPIPGSVRMAVFERDAYRCQMCNGWSDLTVDHIVPVIGGGADSMDNYQTLCRSCNSTKGGRQ